VQPQNTSAFNFATATDEELIQKFASLITQIFDSDENVNDVRILTSDNDVIYRPDYDDSRCWNTINSIQINGQWLSEEGVYLSASGFDDRIIIYLCTNGGSTDIGWIYDWDGNIIKDYNGQSLSDYIMTSVYGYAASAPALSTDGLEQTTQNFVDFVSEGNGAAITEMLPPRLSELAVLNNMSEDDLVQMLLSMHLENCPILEKTISSVCVEMLSIKSASVLGDTDLFDFYSVNQCGVTLTSILNEEGTEYWLAAIWLPLDSAWYLIDTSWYSSLDAIPIALF